MILFKSTFASIVGDDQGYRKLSDGIKAIHLVICVKNMLNICWDLITNLQNLQGLKEKVGLKNMRFLHERKLQVRPCLAQRGADPSNVK